MRPSVRAIVVVVISMIIMFGFTLSAWVKSDAGAGATKPDASVEAESESQPQHSANCMDPPRTCTSTAPARLVPARLVPARRVTKVKPCVFVLHDGLRSCDFHGCSANGYWMAQGPCDPDGQWPVDPKDAHQYQPLVQ